MEIDRIIIQGGGGHAAVVADCLLSQGINIMGFCAEEKADMLQLPYLGKKAAEVSAGARVVVAIGDNATRKRVVERDGLKYFANVVDGSSLVSSRASMGQGCMILHGSTVQARTKIGDHVILNTGCQVDHDCTLASYVHVGPGAVLCGNISVGEGTLIGAGATIIPGIKIGKWAVVGAGSVVISDVPDYTTVAGNPAKPKSKSS